MLSSILGRPRGVLKYSLLANFQGGTPFLQVFFRFCKILNLPYMGETPSIGPAPTILAGVNKVVKSSLLANFRKGLSIFASIVTVFVKF